MIQSVIFLIEKWRCSERRVQSFAKHIKRNQKLWSQGKLSGFVLWELVNWVSEFRLLNLFGRQTWRKIRCFPSQNDAKRLPNTLTINKANSFDPKGTQLTINKANSSTWELRPSQLWRAGVQSLKIQRSKLVGSGFEVPRTGSVQMHGAFRRLLFALVTYTFWHLDTPMALLHRMPVL